MDENERQLVLLREIDALLRAARIRYWLRGGWARDFIAGEITREHGDIDLVTWQRHRARLTRLFEDRRFVVTAHDASVDFQKQGADVNVLFIEKGVGIVYTAGYPDVARWSDDVLIDPPRRLAGLRCRTISPRGLLEELEKTPGWLGRPARSKDIDAAEMLRRGARGTAVIASVAGRWLCG